MVCSVRMEFEEGPKKFLDEAMFNLAEVENLRIHYKNIQAWDTRHDLILLYCPTQPSIEVIADEARQLLDKCERNFKTSKPYLNPDAIHSGEFPKMHCILDWT